MPQRKQPMALEDMARSRIVFWLSSRKDPETTVMSRSMQDRAVVPHALERKLVKSLIENFLCVNPRATWNDACDGWVMEMIAYLLRLDASELDFDCVFKYQRRLSKCIPSEIEQVICRNLPKPSQLRSIKLYGLATNPILQCIAANCKMLVELTCCSGFIDDEGLASFGDFPDGKGCPELEIVKFHFCTRITIPAVARLLRRLKKLTVLSYDYGFRAVAEFLKLQETVVEAGSFEDDGANVIPTLNLTYMMEMSDFSDQFRNNVNMAKIARACPRLTHFKLLYMEEEDIIFTDIELFKKLSSISICEIKRVGSCFQAYISSFGDSVRELDLTCKDFPVDAVLSLGTYCQNLEKLRIWRELSSGCAVRGYPKISAGFRSLRFLLLVNRFSNMEIPEGEVSYLLRSAVKLEELHLSGGLSFMTDAYWNEFLRSVNPMVRLRVLNFDSLPESIRLGLCTARLFIDSCPLLNEIYLGSWTNISAWELTRLKDEVASNNYELLVTSSHNAEIMLGKF
ncbi:unnamed protein product [Notodromas monacha]|uniref:Uncharacterized protein n=1 Tax=Notodromas monacha TaxID=399045 RepID=A0A7R9GEC2_9CRUS|nr:unnamed protein product [Notodromas monacha]CAG0919465.1 unnamed protein product [Notodromas monacha]